MSYYDNPAVVSYSFGSVNFASGSTNALKPPPGMTRGKIVDIQVQVTTLFTAVTNPAFIRLGTPGVPAFYAELNLGVAAATDAYGIRNITAGYDAVVFRSIDIVQDNVAQVRVAFIAPTGGSPAGAGVVNIAVAWF